MKKMIIIFLLISSFFMNPAKAQCSDEILYAMGGVSTLALYNTYISVGAIRDGFSANSYDASKVQDLMAEQVAMISTVNDMIDKTISQTGPKSLTEADKSYMKEIKVAFEYLQAEAAALKDYAQDSGTESLESYNSNRNLAWDKISELMGLEK